ncbi:MAG: hypothetical protein ACREU6_14710, partial [Steroidobacteraceae bacterium]
MTTKRTTTPPRLLVVDDDARYGQWLGHHLGVFCPDSSVTVHDLAGFERRCAADSGRDCDILLLSASFGSSPEDPKALGLELLRRLRGGPDFTAVIALAEKGNELTAVRALQLGAVDYLPKHLLTPERLNTSVRLALRRIEKRAQRKVASLAHVTGVIPPENTTSKRPTISAAAAGETWASMTMTPTTTPSSVVSAPPNAAASEGEGAAATQLMAPGQLEAILGSASAAAASAITAGTKGTNNSVTDSTPAATTAKGSSAKRAAGTPPPAVTAEFIPGYI